MWSKDECQRVKDIVRYALLKAGYDCDLPAGTFSAESFRFTVKVFGDRWQAKQEEWDRHCYKKGLTPDMFGRFFEDEEGQVFQIIEISPRAPKYPVIARREDGKDFKFSAKYAKGRVAICKKRNEKDVTPLVKMLEGQS